jgi:putative zinc finger/helix-turn-helix YgiT family protein
MNCPDCGTDLRVRREKHRYEESGLKYVTLMGIEIARCPRCDYYEVSIPRIEELHRLIAKILIEKLTRFTGAEVRFLRKSLGWSATDFARHIGVRVETVSRWENDVAPIGPQADRLLRLLVAHGKLTTEYPAERLARINARRATATRVELRAKPRHWQLATA